MLEPIKKYFHRADNLPPKEKAFEKTRMLLEVILLVTFLLELFGVFPASVLNYILAPGIVMYAIMFAMKSFNEAPLLSILMIVIAIAVLIHFLGVAF